MITKLQSVDPERLGKEGGTRGNTRKHMGGGTRVVSIGGQGADGMGMEDQVGKEREYGAEGRQ